MNPNQPLWLPKGSVRAILALALVIPVTALALTSGIKLNGDQFVGLVTLILTAYFVDKAARP
jgi:hypothetical protein